MKIDQKKYIQDLLESESISLCYPTVFLIKTSSSLILNQVEDYIQADLVTYPRLIRKVIYLAYKTQLDIAFVVGQLSCHYTNAQVGHLCIVQETFQYLKKTSTLGFV